MFHYSEAKAKKNTHFRIFLESTNFFPGYFIDEEGEKKKHNTTRERNRLGMVKNLWNKNRWKVYYENMEQEQKKNELKSCIRFCAGVVESEMKYTFFKSMTLQSIVEIRGGREWLQNEAPLSGEKRGAPLFGEFISMSSSSSSSTCSLKKAAFLTPKWNFSQKDEAEMILRNYMLG